MLRSSGIGNGAKKGMGRVRLGVVIPANTGQLAVPSSAKFDRSISGRRDGRESIYVADRRPLTPGGLCRLAVSVTTYGIYHPHVEYIRPSDSLGLLVHSLASWPLLTYTSIKCSKAPIQPSRVGGFRPIMLRFRFGLGRLFVHLLFRQAGTPSTHRGFHYRFELRIPNSTMFIINLDSRRWAYQEPSRTAMAHTFPPLRPPEEGEALPRQPPPHYSSIHLPDLYFEGAAYSFIHTTSTNPLAMHN